MRKEYIEDLEGEIWVHNNGYEISNKGRIIGKQGRLLNCKENHCGYLQCSVKFEDGFYARSVHRAVAYMFIPNDDIENKTEVNHIDGNKHNNCVENLEWCTHNYNMKHRTEVLGCMIGTDNPTNKLTEEQVIEIYNLCKYTETKYKDIAKMYGVIPEEVNRIAFGVVWKHLGLEPLPKLVRGSRSRGKKLIWINEDKPYPSMAKCSEDLRNTYNIIINKKIISKICNGELSEYKGQQFKWVS